MGYGENERMRVVEVMLSLAFHAPDTTHGLAALHSLPPLHTASCPYTFFPIKLFYRPTFCSSVDLILLICRRVGTASEATFLPSSVLVPFKRS